MTNAFSKTYGCITFSDMEDLIRSNIIQLQKHNLFRESWEEKRGEITQSEYKSVCRMMLFREAMYLVYGFKPNRVFIIG